MTMLEQILISVLVGGITSGFGAFVGVKVALAKIEIRLRGHDLNLGDHDDRLKYLERRAMIRDKQ